MAEVEVKLEDLESADAHTSAALLCEDKAASCYPILSGALELEKHRAFGSALQGWVESSLCKCLMPPREKQEMLQYLHIPKTGTSINWFLHDYFDNCGANESNPCPNHLTRLDSGDEGLCDGRLFSCAGHRVSSALPEVVLSRPTNLLTMLRDPYKRLQSDYNYILSKPQTEHLSPEINVTTMLQAVSSFRDFIFYPGVANCATKMLNGIPCGDSTHELTDDNLVVAKKVLLAMLWFGISEYFNSSVCLLAWMYGSEPKPLHFKRGFREGTYAHREIVEVLSDDDITKFRESEKYDLELYEFAKSIFIERMAFSGCPLK